jgi:Zn-dependent alcohol dehydrogenase
MQKVRGVVGHKKGEPVSVETVMVPDPGPGDTVVAVQACGAEPSLLGVSGHLLAIAQP